MLTSDHGTGSTVGIVAKLAPEAASPVPDYLRTSPKRRLFIST